MLSKLFHEINKKNIKSVNILSIISALTLKLKEEFCFVSIEYIHTCGTLGLFFNAILDGNKLFIKTHLPGKNYRNNLLKEIKIYKILYKDLLYINHIDLNICDHDYSFLIMDYLKPLKDNLKPDEMKLIIKDYSNKLKDVLKDENLVKNIYTFDLILREAKNALKELSKEKLINSYIEDRCYEYISILKYDPLEDATICHGDLSNKNIMLKDDSIIVIDWEDMFLGTKDYDFCFWLTFFNQRKYYNEVMFLQYEVDKLKCIAYMIVIVILKCYLSYKNCSYLTNLVKMDDRLYEIINL